MNIKEFFVKLSKVNKDVWLLLFIVLPVVGAVVFVRCSEANSLANDPNCKDKVYRKYERKVANGEKVDDKRVIYDLSQCKQ